MPEVAGRGGLVLSFVEGATASRTSLRAPGKDGRPPALTGAGNVKDQARALRRAGRKPVGNWLIMPVLILLFAAVYLALFSPLISWITGGGTQGIFVARELNCHKGCAWFGDFTGTNQAAVLRDVRFANLSDRPGITKGTAIPVTDISSVLFHGVAYPRPASRHDLLSPPVLVAALLGLVPVILLLSWIWTVPFRYWRARGSGERSG
jgi:hypothetical protein